MTARNKGMSEWVMPVLSWLVSACFLSGYVIDAGFPPSVDIGLGQLTLLGIFLFFLFLPFFKRVKVGNWLELEREVEKTKTELREFKQDVQANLSLISTNVNTIGNLSNQVTVNLPAYSETQEAALNLDKQVSQETLNQAREIRDELLLDGEDSALALARTRMRIEYLLRRILGKRLAAAEAREGPVRFMTLQKMFREFVREHPEHDNIERSFSYVIQICDAAIHAQHVSLSQAEEALRIGSRIIAILSAAADIDEPAATQNTDEAVSGVPSRSGHVTQGEAVCH